MARKSYPKTDGKCPVSTYYHRIFRTEHLIRVCTNYVDKGINPLDLVSRSGLCRSFATLYFRDPKSIEVAALSYIPYYCKGKRMKVMNLIKRNFGLSVRESLEDLDVIWDLYDEGDIDGINKYPRELKDMFLLQSYVDICMCITADVTDMIFDGKKLHIDADKDIAIYGDYEEMSRIDFLEWIMETMSYKVDNLEGSSVYFKQCLIDITNRFREQEGYEFNIVVDKEESYPDIDKIPTILP